VRVSAIQHGEGAPFGSGAVEALDIARNPLSLSDVRRMRDDAHLLAVIAGRRERVLGNINGFFVMPDCLPRDTKDSSGGPVVER